MNAGILTIVLAVSLTTKMAFGQADGERELPTASAASAVDPNSSTVSSKSHNANYVIGDEDVLDINVWQEPGLTVSVPVRSDGMISLPLIGDVQAAGRAPTQLEQDIAAKLRTYIVQPEVAVIVQKINSKKFNILGRVAKPGSYSLSSTTTVLDAIAEAGGFMDFAKKNGIYILRHNPNGGVSRIAFNYGDVVKGKHPEENFTLEPHDTMIVP
ncbi:MAG: polysaccharide biosynthesis/export family protein [Silvibacterium sp.]